MSNIDQRLIAATNAQNRRIVEVLESKSEQTCREQWVLGSITDLRRVIRDAPPEAFRLPVHFNAIMPGAELEALEALLEQLRSLNNECVGMSMGEAQLLLSQDDRATQLIDDLHAAYAQIITYRLRRHNSKDSGNAYRQFDRIYDELLPGLDRILEFADTVSCLVLHPVQDRAAWDLYSRTWRSWVQVTPMGVHFAGALDGRLKPLAMRTFGLYAWMQADDLQSVLNRTTVPPDGAPNNPAATRAAIEGMAEDLAIMRPLMAPNFDPLKTQVQVGPNQWAVWFWALTRLGGIGVASSQRELIAAHTRTKFPQLLGVDYGGDLSVWHMPWRATHLDDLDTLAAHHAILKALYDPLLEMYCRIDVDAILARYRRPDPETTPVVPADHAQTEADTAAIAALARADDQARTPDLTRRIRGLRLVRLTDALTSLGCTVRQGKGSEIIVHRPGHRMARLGRHKRNPEVSPYAICNALRRLGLSVRDLVRAFDR